MQTIILCSLFFIVCCASALAQRYSVETFTDQLHLNAFKYIANDTTAQQFFGVPRPLNITVFEHVRCFPFLFKKIVGITEWVHAELGYSLDPFDKDYWRCKESQDPKLRTLSTAEDSVVSLVFMQIDSTFLPGYYVVAADLYHYPGEMSPLLESNTTFVRHMMAGWRKNNVRVEAAGCLINIR